MLLTCWEMVSGALLRKEDRSCIRTLQIPPKLFSSPASNIVTSKPWPTQWEADETPVRPAPMMAIRGRCSVACGGGGVGERSLSRIHWRIE